MVCLTGQLVTCRDVAHRRLIELGRELPVGLKGGAIFHAGPIVKQQDDGSYETVSIGPTTSMRMEKFEREFIKQTGVKLVVGMGGMGTETAAGCVEDKARFAAKKKPILERINQQVSFINSRWRGSGPIAAPAEAQDHCARPLRGQVIDQEAAGGNGNPVAAREDLPARPACDPP